MEDNVMALLKKCINTLRFIGAYASANIQAALEYRVSFVVQVLTMVANDSLWLFFWWTYFRQFPLTNGWQNTDVVILWAVAAGGFGLSVGIFGNARQLTSLIMNGGLMRIWACRVMLYCTSVSRPVIRRRGEICSSPQEPTCYSSTPTCGISDSMPC